VGDTVAVNDEAAAVHPGDDAAPPEAKTATEPALPDGATPTDEGTSTDETAPSEGEGPGPVPPRPVPQGRRIRSASALLVAALLVAIGVFLTLGGVDALVGHGAAVPGVHPSGPSSPAPTSVRPAGLL
jgi:hypothetical protein